MKHQEREKKKVHIPEKGYQRRNRDTEAGGCKRKKTFKTLPEAQAAADAMSLATGVLTVPYECKFCKEFHLSKDGNDVLDLPDTYKDQPVFFDERGPYLKVQVFCVKCNKPEPATIRISVVDGAYTRTQGIVLDDPKSMKHPKSGSKAYVHANGCPVEAVPATPNGDLEEHKVGLTDTPPVSDKPRDAEGMTGFMLEVPFDEEVLMELSIVLDPVNRSTYSADFAQGASWLFHRTLMARLHKQKEKA